MLDNEIQIRILKSLNQCYPNYSMDIIRVGHESQDILNLHYLNEQGYVNANLERSVTGSFIFEGASIDAKGIEYLKNILVKNKANNIISDTEVVQNKVTENTDSWYKKPHGIVFMSIVAITIASLFVDRIKHFFNLPY